MTDARDNILGRLRAGAAGARVEQAGIPVRRFDWDANERLRRFSERMEAVRGEVHVVDDDWPKRLYSLLKAKGARNLLYGPGTAYGTPLQEGWPDPTVELVPYLGPVETCREALFDDTDAAFSGCRGAIAETGTLVLWPTPAEPRLMSLVPPIHVVLLQEADIRSTFHELMIEQGWAKGMPTNAILVSGPSKSADIEQTLAYGVHGPKELIVLVNRAA